MGVPLGVLLLLGLRLGVRVLLPVLLGVLLAVAVPVGLRVMLPVLLGVLLAVAVILALAPKLRLLVGVGVLVLLGEGMAGPRQDQLSRYESLPTAGSPLENGISMT